MYVPTDFDSWELGVKSPNSGSNQQTWPITSTRINKHLPLMSVHLLEYLLTNISMLPNKMIHLIPFPWFHIKCLKLLWQPFFELKLTELLSLRTISLPFHNLHPLQKWMMLEILQNGFTKWCGKYMLSTWMSPLTNYHSSRICRMAGKRNTLNSERLKHTGFCNLPLK